MISKDSTNEDVLNFLNNYLKETEKQKIKDENIKSNELFFFDNFKTITKNQAKLNKKLEDIKSKNKDIMSFDIILNESSKEEDINNFLKLEMKIKDEKVLDKFRNINGLNFINLDEDNLNNFGFKLGERKKLSFYLNHIKNIITNEICEFLKEKFQISDETMEKIEDNGITWDEFYKLSDEDYNNYDLEEEKKIKIQKYIEEKKLEKEKAEKIMEVDNSIYKIY